MITQDITGRVYGRLRVTGRSDIRQRGGSMWNCLCECGNETVVKIGKLSTGSTKSCGCLRKEVAAQLKLSHAQARKYLKTKTYVRWKGMKQRCTNPSHRSYKNYGGRGIKVCERWMDYSLFFADMGEAPEGMLLDRINNDGNYEPGNCRWVDPKTSARNRRKRKSKYE